ncbi:MAG: hypothetical protein C0410_11775 [Anaerolinea sp.]|nr:hypothetical protein [Anaerolinea sp.]
MNPMHPVNSLFQFLKMVFLNRVHFLKNRVGQVYDLGDGLEWVIFREMKIDPLPNEPAIAEVHFRPRFHVAGMSLKKNILFSIFPIPFFAGLPGFRSKLWLYNLATGDFSGWYEWVTARDAENYSKSFAVKFMTNRSIPGSVSFQIVPIAKS